MFTITNFHTNSNGRQNCGQSFPILSANLGGLCGWGSRPNWACTPSISCTMHWDVHVCHLGATGCKIKAPNPSWSPSLLPFPYLLCHIFYINFKHQ